MKSLSYIFTTVIAAGLIALAGACEPISNPEPRSAVDTTKTATIQGTVYANLDESNDDGTATMEENYENAPAGTQVKVVFDAGDFGNPAAFGNSLSYTTEVDGSGNYEIEVPAQDTPITAEIYVDSFQATQTLADGTQQEMTFEPVSFPYNVAVTAGFQSFQDIVYQAN
jgi:hypothetical protein